MTKNEWLEAIKLGISALTFASVIIAYRAYRANLTKQNEDRIRDRDKELLAQAKESISWAYAALTDQGKNKPPSADRLNWLTAARHLLRAKKLADKITHQTFRTIYDEVEEYWRHQFYVLLSHDSLRKWSYYADLKHPNSPENIETTSALVVIDFSNWKDGVSDPTDEVDREAMLERGVLQAGPGRGLGDYMSHLEDIRAQRRVVKNPGQPTE